MPPTRDYDFTCPVCGETVHAGALACPHCGADDNSGWREDADEADFETGNDFDYERFVADEFGAGPGKMARPAFGWFWWIVGVILAIAFGAIIFRG